MYCKMPYISSRQKYCFFIKTLPYNILLYNKLRLRIISLSLFMTSVIKKLLYFDEQALMKALNKGCGVATVLLYSGWYCTPT